MLGRLSLTVLLLIAVGKLLTTSISIGAGGSGGVFGPSMVIGGSLGGVVGILAQRLMPSVVIQPAAFVPVGMAGFFAAAANTPISTLIMVSEMTGNYQLLRPSLWVCAISFLLGRRWTLYRSQVPGRADSPYTPIRRLVRIPKALGVSFFGSGLERDAISRFRLNDSAPQPVPLLRAHPNRANLQPLQ